MCDARRAEPAAVLVSHRLYRRIVCHGIRDTLSPVASAWHVVTLRAAVVHAEREVEPVVQHLRLSQAPCREALLVGAFYHALVVEVVEAYVVARLAGSATHREVVVVAEARALHLFLPVGVGALVVGQGEVVGLGVVAQVGGRGELKVVCHAFHGGIAPITYSRGAVASFLCCHYDDAVGSLRAIYSRCRGVAQHVDAFNVVGRQQ